MEMQPPDGATIITYQDIDFKDYAITRDGSIYSCRMSGWDWRPVKTFYPSKHHRSLHVRLYHADGDITVPVHKLLAAVY